MQISKPVLVVLGASLDQSFMIRTAQEMGLSVLALDMNPDAPGKDIADHFAAISTKDIDKITAYLDTLLAQGISICGVTTMGSDIPDVVVDLARHLGTPSISRESAEISIDKMRMKSCFQKNEIPIPWFKEIESYGELADIISHRGYDLVIKPNDRSGSRGVFRLNNTCDVKGLFHKARDFSFSKRVLVEEFLPGLQISTETIMVDGKGHTVGFADRNYEDMERFHPQIMENGGWIPSVLSAPNRKAVEDLVERTSLALGITDGVTKGDVVMAPGGPTMIEMAARLSGGDFSAGLVPLGTGMNYVKTVIEIAIGHVPTVTDLQPVFAKAVANRYFFPQAGRLVRVDGVDEVRSWNWVEKLEFWYKPGDDVPPALSHAHRFGVFVVTAPNRNVLSERIAKVYDTISIVTKALL